MKHTWMTLAIVALLCGGAWSAEFDVTPSMVGNSDLIKGRLGFGDPNEGMIGPYGSWNDEDPEHLWGVGGYAQLDISKQVSGLIDKTLGTPDAWWELLEALGGKMYLVAEVGPADLAGEPQATATPLVGMCLGPLVAEMGYSLIEGGEIRGRDGEELAGSGPVYFIGITKTFRF